MAALEYNTDLFDAGTVGAACGAFRSPAPGCRRRPGARAVVGPAAAGRRGTAAAPRATGTTRPWTSPAEPSVQSLFERQVARTPHAVAVASMRRDAELRRAQRAREPAGARTSRAPGVGPEVLVGLCAGALARDGGRAARHPQGRRGATCRSTRRIPTDRLAAHDGGRGRAGAARPRAAARGAAGSQRAGARLDGDWPSIARRTGREPAAAGDGRTSALRDSTRRVRPGRPRASKSPHGVLANFLAAPATSSPDAGATVRCCPRPRCRSTSSAWRSAPPLPWAAGRWPARRRPRRRRLASASRRDGATVL